MFRPSFTKEWSLRNIVIAPDNSTYTFPSSEPNFRMYEEIRILLEKIESRPGTEGTTKLEVILEADETKIRQNSRKPEEEPRE